VKTSKPKQQTPIIDPRIRAALIVSNYGTPENQKDVLVTEILDVFTNPQQWPMSDTDRIELLRRWYRSAQRIRETEKAIASYPNPAHP
jgi:hypothetical protein